MQPYSGGGGVAGKLNRQRVGHGYRVHSKVMQQAPYVACADCVVRTYMQVFKQDAGDRSMYMLAYMTALVSAIGGWVYLCWVRVGMLRGWPLGMGLGNALSMCSNTRSCVQGDQGRGGRGSGRLCRPSVGHIDVLWPLLVRCNGLPVEDFHSCRIHLFGSR